MTPTEPAAPGLPVPSIERRVMASLQRWVIFALVLAFGCSLAQLAQERHGRDQLAAELARATCARVDTDFVCVCYRPPPVEAPEPRWPEPMMWRSPP